MISNRTLIISHRKKQESVTKGYSKCPKLADRKLLESPSLAWQTHTWMTNIRGRMDRYGRVHKGSRVHRSKIHTRMYGLQRQLSFTALHPGRRLFRTRWVLLVKPARDNCAAHPVYPFSSATQVDEERTEHERPRTRGKSLIGDRLKPRRSSNNRALNSLTTRRIYASAERCSSDPSGSNSLDIGVRGRGRRDGIGRFGKLLAWHFYF